MDATTPLTPILLTGYGRSGSTALMALLGTDPRVAFDSVYPFENRYLTYLAKFARLSARSAVDRFRAREMCDEGTDELGPPPWAFHLGDGPTPMMPSPHQWMGAMWPTFCGTVRAARPDAVYYAEKAPAWLAAWLRTQMPVKVIHLMRDPRDVFLSVNDFERARHAAGFDIEHSLAQPDHIRGVAHGLLTFAENERDDRGRPDTIAIRYEDWVNEPETVAAQLSHFLGIDLRHDDPSVGRHRNRHATTKDVSASVARWRREPLPLLSQHRLHGLISPIVGEYGYEYAGDEAEPADVVPDPDWPHSDDGQWTRQPDRARVTIQGDDAWVEFPEEPLRAETVDEFWLCVRGATGDHHSVYWRGRGEPFAAEKAVHVPYRPGEHWQIVRVPVSQHPLWRGDVEQLRVDTFNGAVTPGTRGEIRWVRRVGERA